MTAGADPRAQQREGSVLDDKWTLERLLGSGGMGAVYAARHRNGARAAVKILHPELARIADVRERFLREGYAANRVEHRGAVQVLDDDIVRTGADEGSAYLVMELLEGESLQDRALRSPKLGEHELLAVMDAVLDVLAAAHAHGVIHRDLKPENIFLAKDPEREGVRVKVLDFGLARLAEGSAVTSAGMAVGTPSFMSPEQASGRSEEVDGRTDIFALGATIFRVLTGRRIHDADNMVQLVGLMATVPAPRLRSVAPDVSEAFARIVDRALAFSRHTRYLDADAMGADVRAALHIGRASNPSLYVIPFSARSARVGSAAGGAESDVNDVHDVASTSPISKRRAAAEHAAPMRRETRQGSGRSFGRSATVPWVIVLLLLAVGAWQFGPSLQAELVRRASLEPVKALWTPTEPEPAAPPADVSVDAGLAATGTEDEPDPVSPPSAEEDEVLPAPAPAPTVAPVHDAGSPRVTAARPPPLPVHTAKPPAKKPTPPAPAPSPPRKRHH